MLKKLTVRGFKSLADVTLELPQLSVLFGPNAAGKSNLLDAIQALSWMGNARTLWDAFSPLRGHPFEAFFFGTGGWPELFQQRHASFMLEADLDTYHGSFRYRIEPELDFGSGQLRVTDEYLTQLTQSGRPMKNRTPAIERVSSNFHIRRKGKPAHPRQEPVGLNHSVLSDRSLSGEGYPWLDTVRKELFNWRTHYFEPRVAMRSEESPTDVYDIGIHGQYIASFLYKIRAQHPKRFDAVHRTLRAVVPSIDTLHVELDERRGTLNLWIQQAGVAYSSRIVSEGTLRVLALCTIAVNPWGGSLVALEEPENGVHPRRIELIAQMLTSLALDRGRQVVVTTHSPLFCDAILNEARSRSSDDIALFNVRRVGPRTQIQRFTPSGPLFDDPEIAAALASQSEDGVFERLILRGLIDE